MKQGIYKIKSNKQLTDAVWEIRLEGDFSANRPGQFVNAALPGLYLRRPISVCDANENELALVYKTIGKGTELLSMMKAGDELDLLSELGNGYDLEKSGQKPLLIGGGVGIPPLFMAAKELIAQGKKATAILGFNTANEIFYANEFEKLGAKVIITTADGSAGIKGFVTDALDGVEHSSIFTCGPLPMLKAVFKADETPAQFSLEERMGCGFGACMGCTIMTTGGAKRICKDGPVFKKEELLFS